MSDFCPNLNRLSRRRTTLTPTGNRLSGSRGVKTKAKRSGGPLAKSDDPLIRNDGVGGSNPACGTITLFSAGRLSARKGSTTRHPPQSRWQQKVFEDVLEGEALLWSAIWGPNVDDNLNTPWMWCAHICSYATKWMKNPHHWTREDTEESYDRMIQTSAIAAAAAESILRQREYPRQDLLRNPTLDPSSEALSALVGASCQRRRAPAHTDQLPHPHTSLCDQRKQPRQWAPRTIAHFPIS